MVMQPKDLFLMVLKRLDETSFAQFKTRLSTLDVKKKYQRIPSSRLEDADPQSVSDLILEFYRNFYGMTVFQAVLDAINEKTIWNTVLDELEDNRYNLDIHRSDLIRLNVRIDSILYYLHYLKLLTDEQYDEFTKRPTYQEKIEGLLDTVRCWDDISQMRVFWALEHYNPEVYKEITDHRKWNYIKIGEICYSSGCFKHNQSSKEHTASTHFLEKNKDKLIKYIIMVDPVLDDLRDQRLLTQRQRKNLMKKATPSEKMRSLCDTVRTWSYPDKEKVYKALKKYNYNIIKNLVTKEDRYDPSSTHFLEKNKDKLIKYIIMVDPVLDDLRDQRLLTQRQRKNLMKKATPSEKMRSLCDTVRTWSYPDKEKVYKALKKYNYNIIKNLVTKEDRYDPYSLILLRNHFLDGNREELIGKIRNVDPVLRDLLDQRLLTEWQYMKLREETSSEEKMRSLCDTMRAWSHANKDKAYDALRRHNYQELRAMERSYVPSLVLSDISTPDYLYQYGLVRFQGSAVKSEIKMKVPPLSLLAKEHFLDRYWSFLMRKIKFVDPVVYDLRNETLITEEEFQNVIGKASSRDKMCELFGIISSWDHRRKDILYDVLWRYNCEEMSILEDQDQNEWNPLPMEFETDPSSYGGATNLKPSSTRESSSWLMQEIHFTREKQDVGVLSHHMECRLCGKFQDSGVVLNPDVIANIYRLKLKSAGLFCCRKTGIKFQVAGPVDIDYYLESWSDYWRETPGSQQEIIGPLFNIKINEPMMANAVSAVYLPHYLCLRSFTEDQLNIKCAHFTDGNMVLKSPARVEPFHIVLENPSFSCLGPLLLLVKKKIPMHGVVFLYFRVVCPGELEYQEYKIHLHLMPLTAHIEEKLDKEKMKLGFKRIAKPPQTNDSVYRKTKYLITSDPQDYVLPKTLKFQSSHHSEPSQFTEISVKGNDINISLGVADESTKETVWDTILTRGDIKDLSRSGGWLRSKTSASSLPVHFVDKHRTALIERLSNIDSVLDDLLGQSLLTQEQYENIRKREPHQEKMRQLYQYETSWGITDKEKFFQAILRCNMPLVSDLEGP
ncbi:uncharacterized protein ACMZJ9_009938 [Mantella aurantiaca]